jgi:uncharacterized protein YjbI with pentapeptide repeats
VAQEQQPNKQIAGDRLLKWIGLDPAKWTEGDRRLALLAIGIVLALVIITVCGYIFGWEWTGLVKPKRRTFWDWLSLLIVPIVLALGGYFFTRSESRRTKEDAERQRKVDRQIADQRAQDEALQAYLDQVGQLLLDNDPPLRQSEEDSEVRTLARARTLTVLSRLDGDRKARVVQFLYESGLIAKGPVLDLRGANLNGANLSEANLSYADLSEAYLKEASLSDANLIDANLSEADMSHADLTWADLSYADLGRANLRGSVLFHAYLSAANLNNANLDSANLREASLIDADLSGANLSKADLTGAEGVTNEELEQQAASLEGATMPNGQKYEDWLKDKKAREEGG